MSLKPHSLAPRAVARHDSEEIGAFCRYLLKHNLLYRTEDDRVLIRSGDRLEYFDKPGAKVGLKLFSIHAVELAGERGVLQPTYDHYLKLGSDVFEWAINSAPLIRRFLQPWAFIGEGKLRKPEQGYDAATGALSCGGPGSNPLLMETEKLEHLPRLFSGIYGEGAQQVRLLCSLVAIAARPATGEFPLLIIESAAKNSGKSRVAAAFSEVYGGAVLAEVNRLDQRLGGRAHRPGPNVFVFDNLRHTVASMRLSGAVSQPAIIVEPKYRNLCPVYDPIFILTMNAGRVEDDLADKAVFVTLSRQGLAPGEPAIMLPDPLEYARQHRQQLLAEISAVLDGLEWSRPELPVSRFVAWEAVMQAIAGRLGVQLDLTMGQNRNQLVRELLSAYDANSRDGQGVRLVDIVGTLRANRDAREANFFMSSLAVSTDEQRAQGLADWVQLHVAELPLMVGKMSVKINVQEGNLLQVRKI